MSIGEKLLEGLDKAKAKAHDAGEEFIDEKGADGIDKILDKGEELIGEYVDEQAKQDAKAALDEIRNNKDPFLRLGQDGFASILGHWENADETAARHRYLQYEATFDELMDAMDANTDALIDAEDQARAAREAAWETAKTVLKKVGTAGVGFLVRAAAASFGIPLP